MMLTSFNIIEEWKPYNDDITFPLNVIKPIKDLFSVCFLK